MPSKQGSMGVDKLDDPVVVQVIDMEVILGELATISAHVEVLGQVVSLTQALVAAVAVVLFLVSFGLGLRMWRENHG